MAIGKTIKTAGVVLSAVAGTAGAVTEVVKVVNENTQTVVVEEYNYEYQHIINESDTYLINGEEVTAEEWEAKKAGNDAATTRTEDKDIVTIDDGAFVVYYGASTTLPKDLNSLTKVEYASTPATFITTIKCGDPDTEEGQYPLIAIPNTVVIQSWKVSGFSLEFDKYAIGNFDVYHLKTQSYDEHLGGIEYTVYFAN